MKQLFIMVLCACAVLGAFQTRARYQFDKGLGLKPYPAKNAERVVLDGEAAFNGHGALRMNHTQEPTVVYCTIGVPQAPCEMDVTVNLKASVKCEVNVELNFNLKGGGNGSAGNARFKLSAVPAWGTQRVQCAVPPNTERVQCVISVSGTDKTLWLNDLRFGFANDALELPVVEKMDLAAGLETDSWNAQAPLQGFFSMGSPAMAPVEARLAADKTGLYVAFRNSGKPVAAAFGPDKRDQALWNDDCNEVFLFNMNTEKGWQFIVNSRGALFDAGIYQNQAGDPWRANADWNSDGVKTQATVLEEGWESRLFIPWKTLGLSTDGVLELGLNLAVENKAYKEDSMWNCFAGKFNDPAGFAKLRIADGRMQVVRSRVVQNISYTIERKSPKFAELLKKGVPGNYLMSTWGHGLNKGDFPQALVEKVGEEGFAAWQKRLLEVFCASGTQGPAYPWLQNYIPGGARTILELNEKYGFKAPFSLHNSALDRMSRERGAAFILARDTKKVSPIDPVLNAVEQEFIRGQQKSRFYDLYKKTTGYILGYDEPFNGYTEMYSKSMNSRNVAALDKVDAAIREKYGFGKYGLPDYFAEPDAAQPFRYIAFNRWFNDELLAVSRQWSAVLEETFPGVPQFMIDNNTCAGLAPLDYSLFEGHTDWLGCDPYPTSAKSIYSFDRALYHTGFSTRLLNDLAPHTKTMVAPQGFIYHGGKPKPSDLREWSSQALKNGADGFMWYAAGAAHEIFDCYREMFAINALAAKMDKIDLPTATKTAVLFSNYDQYGTNDGVQHAAYSLYVLLGEQLKSNFRFISITGLQKGIAKLADYKLVYVPKLTYTDPQLTAQLRDFVRDGGRLVVFDPRFLSWNIDGTAVAERAMFTGMGAVAAMDTASGKIRSVKVGGKELPLAANTHVVLPTGRNVEAYSLAGVSGNVVGTYADGSPAVVENSLGGGTVVYFGAQPFGNSSLAIRPGAWLEFFKREAATVGEVCDLPIWDFTIPESALVRPEFEPLQ